MKNVANKTRRRGDNFYAFVFGNGVRDFGTALLVAVKSTWTQRGDIWAYIVALICVALSMHYPYWDNMQHLGVVPESWAGMCGNAWAGYFNYMLLRYGFPATNTWQSVKQTVKHLRTQG